MLNDNYFSEIYMYLDLINGYCALMKLHIIIVTSLSIGQLFWRYFILNISEKWILFRLKLVCQLKQKMVKFKSNRSLPYTRIDGLDNCEINLCLSSDEESQKDVNNEESGDKSSHFIDPENYIFLVCLSVSVFNFGILYVLKHNYSTDIHKVVYVFYSGLLIVGTIMIVIVIHSNSNRLYSYWLLWT